MKTYRLLLLHLFNDKTLQVVKCDVTPQKTLWYFLIKKLVMSVKQKYPNKHKDILEIMYKLTHIQGARKNMT